MRRKAEGTGRFSDEMLLMTARLYYVDGLPQADVARVMRVSQPQISRLLSLARDRGIVRISVADYDPRDRELEKLLVTELGLNKPIVIKTIRGSKVKDLRYTVAHFAAADVAQLVAGVHTLAIAGGRTLQDLCQQFKEPPRKASMAVVQAMGNVGSTPSGYDALELGRHMAAIWGGSFFMLNTPVLLPDIRTRDAIMSLGENQEVVRRFGKCELALVGMGTLQNSMFTERGIFTDRDMKMLVQAKAVGEICGRFFNAEGDECDTSFRDRVASIKLEQLQKMPQVIAVTIGSDRAAALSAAIKGNIVKSVVIDDAGAQALLDINQRLSRVPVAAK